MAYINIVHADGFLKKVAKSRSRVVVHLHCFTQEDYNKLKKAEENGELDMNGNEIKLIENENR